VSPLWRDEIGILIAPRRVALTRMGRGIRPRCIGEAARSVNTGSLTDWRPALTVLHNCLAEAAWQGANARVVISDHWVRYAIVPWSGDISNDEERTAHGRICLAKIYGNVADQWRVSLSEGAPGESRVACAMPEHLLDEIRTTLDSFHTPLVSAQPQLIAAYNRWCDKLPLASGWFVTIDEGTLAAARLVRGGWDRVYSARIGTDWAVELQRLKTFGRLAAQDNEFGRVFVDAPLWLRELAGDCGVGIEWLVDERTESTAGDDLSVLKRPLA
jgi:hypothetical protein